jgi:hypothetical protein
MKKTFGLIVFALISVLFGCDTEQQEEPAPVCEVNATVRDLRGLDGCGFVFELEDGTRLEPIRVFYCGTPPLAAEIQNDPLFDFEFTEGKRVKISFNVMNDIGSICMAGPSVKITCLTERPSNQTEL